MNQELADAIRADNEAEDAGMHGDERKTCWTHQCWASECAGHPMHTNPGARWADEARPYPDPTSPYALFTGDTGQ